MGRGHYITPGREDSANSDAKIGFRADPGSRASLLNRKLPQHATDGGTRTSGRAGGAGAFYGNLLFRGERCLGTVGHGGGNAGHSQQVGGQKRQKEDRLPHEGCCRCTLLGTCLQDSQLRRFESRSSAESAFSSRRTFCLGITEETPCGSKVFQKFEARVGHPRARCRYRSFPAHEYGSACWRRKTSS